MAAGTRAYVVGVENGTFPPIGWHITGQTGGVWAPPVKLLDGLWFRVAHSWLDSAATYTSGPGFVRLSFPVTDGLRPTLTEFAPDGLQTVLFGLTLVPASGQATTVSVAADAHSQVAAAFPWSSTTPYTFDTFNHQNTVSANSGVVGFNQQHTNWYAEVGSATTPASTATGSGYWGPTPASQQPAFGTKGQGGELTWKLPVPAAGRTLWLGVAGSQTGSKSALATLHAGLANPSRLLASKIAGRDALAAQTNVQVPDASVQRALLWSKLNLADLRRTITDAAIRDTKAGTVYPKPLATAAWAAHRENAMLAAFGQWWIARQHLYADSICVTAGGSCSAAGQKLQQRWWTSVAPMEQDVAPAARGQAALTRMEGSTFTGSCGLFVDGVGGPSGTGGQTCYLVNTGALAVGEANYGRLPQSVTDMNKVAGQLTVEMPGSLPELAKSAQYNPFEAFTSRANVMQAWSSYGLLWTVVNDLLGVTPDMPARSVAVVPEVPPSWPGLSVRDLRLGTRSLAGTASHQGSVHRTAVTGAQGLALTIGTVLAAGAAPHSVTLNGKPVPYHTVTTHPGTAVEVSVPHSARSEMLAVQT